MKRIVFSIIFLLTFVFIQAQSPFFATNTPTAGRYDDLSFINRDTGWAVGNTGTGIDFVIRTNDGGVNWVAQKTFSNYPRSVEFSSPKRGFLGCLDASGQNIFWKTLDGGITWMNISSVITGTNSGICGICSVDTNVTYAVGVFASPAYVIKTVNGGNTWTQIDMSAYASCLVDVQFKDALTGFVTGQSNISSEGAVILKTTNGGVTWTKVFTNNIAGDYLWKIQNLDGMHWYGSIEKAASSGWNCIVKSSDGGNTWISKNVYYGTAIWERLQMIGFLDSLNGWTGSTKLCQTWDGGNTWIKVDSGGSYDRFQRINSSVAYLSSRKVLKLQPGWAGIKEIGDVKYNNLYPDLKVFPNPTKNNFTVELILPCKTIYNLRIISVSGNSVIWDEVGQKEKAGTYEFKINQKLAAGEYLVHVMTNEGAASKKIIVTD